MPQMLQFSDQFTEAQIIGDDLGQNVGDIYKAADTGKLFEVLDGGGVVEYMQGCVYSLDFSARYYLYVDNRWVSQTVVFGTNSQNCNQNLGTGAVPNPAGDGGGHLVKAGKVLRVDIEADVNNAEVTELEVSLIHKGRGSSGAETVLYNWPARPVTILKDGFQINEALNNVTFDEGKLMLAIKPTNTGTATRYAYVSARVKVQELEA